jgi:hypothetical protein
MADAVDLLRKIAHSLADVEETVACAGTAPEEVPLRPRRWVHESHELSARGPSAKKKSAKKKSAKKKSAKKR